MNYDRLQSAYENRKSDKILKKYYLKQDENEKNKDKINNSVINLRNEIISAELIKKRMSKELIQRKNMEKLNIVSSFHFDNDKSLFEELMKNKYLKEKNKSLEDEIAYFNRTKETLTDNIKNIKGSIFKTIGKANSTLRRTKDNIKTQIKKLIS